MNTNAGALYLPVKLDVSNAQREIDQLGVRYKAAFQTTKVDTDPLAAMLASLRNVENAYNTILKQAQELKTLQAVPPKPSAPVSATSAANNAARERISAERLVATELNQQTTALAAQGRLDAALVNLDAQRVRLATAQTNQAAKQASIQARQGAEMRKSAGALSSLGGLFGSAATGALGAGAAMRGGGMFGAFVAVRNIGDVFNKAKEAAAGLGATGAMAGGAIAAAFATAALAVTGVAAGFLALGVEIGKVGITSAMKLETLGLQLEGLLGSATKAKEELSFLLALGETSTVPTEALIAADRQLAAFGVNVDETRRSLVQFFSDFGTATSATESQIYFLSLALSQVSSYGKANSVDMRQLANAGINVGRVYKIIGDQIGVSTRKVKEGVSDGIVTADRLFAALEVYGQGFAETAAKARKSTAGLLANIQDVFVTRLGIAFQSVNKNIAGILESVMNVLQKVNFEPLGKSFQNAMIAIGRALGQTIGPGGNFDLQFFFEHTLPDAIEKTGQAVAIFLNVIKIGINIVRAAIGVLAMAITPMVLMINGAVRNMITVAAALGLVSDESANAILKALDTSETVLGTLRDGVVQAFGDIQQAMTDALGSGLTVPNATNAADQLKAQAATSDESLRGRAQDYAKVEDEAKKLNKALKELAGTLNEKFLDSDGKFTATAKEVRKASEEVKAAILAAMPKGADRTTLLKSLETETDALAALAKRRDKLAKQLSAAQEKLKALISERESFAQQIKDDAIGFVNDLTAATEKTWTATKFAQDGVQGWSFTQQTDAEAFAEGLKTRLEAYRDFVDNVKKLAARGLDPALLRQIIEAGPEAGGALAEGLAGASNATIRDVNQTQNELNDLATTFAEDQASAYYDAGIGAARNVVTGLKSQLKNVDSAAKEIISTLKKAIKDAKPDMKAQGAALGNAIGMGIKKGVRDSLKGSFGSYLDANPWHGTPATPATGTIDILPQGFPTITPQPQAPFTGTGYQMPTVQVFIGQQEITDIVDTRVAHRARTDAQGARRGKRYPTP